MTFSTASAAEGSTIMASTARIARIVIVATGILALSVTAAQARPIGVGYTGQSAPAHVSNGYHSLYGPSQDAAVGVQRQQALYKHDAAANIADSGFNWTAGMLGAGIATLVLLLAAITASRIRPHRVAQL
jgi:hypothetical protein